MRIIYKRIFGEPYCKICSYQVAAPKQLKKRSSKKIKIDNEYSILRKEYLELHPKCEINFICCTHTATDVHHIEYRGINTNNVNTWKACCRSCHDHLHKFPKEARELNLLK